MSDKAETDLTSHRIAADMVVVNGKIVTVDSHDTIAEAAAVKFGKILAVGTNDEVRTSITDATTAYFKQLRTTQTLRNETVRMVSSIRNMKVESDGVIPAIKEVTDVIDDENIVIEDSVDLINEEIEARQRLALVIRGEKDRRQENSDDRKKQNRKEADAKKKASADQIQADADVENLKQAKIQTSFDLARRLTTTFTDIFAAQKEKELSAVGDNAEAREEIEKKFARREQVLAIGKAIVDGASALQKIQGQLGIAAPPFLIASAALTAAQIAVIASQKFAEGGPIHGQSHSMGGVPIEAEGGEYMINKRSTSKHLDLIRAINSNDQSGIANAALQNSAFHEVWDRSRARRNVAVQNDPYTKKIYETLNRTPVFVPEGKRTEKYPDGRTRIING